MGSTELSGLLSDIYLGILQDCRASDPLDQEKCDFLVGCGLADGFLDPEMEVM